MISGAEQYDCIIIGAGPAGMSAGIYLARRQLKILLLSKDIGGQAAWSSDVENYLGFYLLSGPELAAKFASHIRDFNVAIKEGVEVKGITGQAPNFMITTNVGSFHTKTILVASGKIPRRLNVPGEQEFLGKGVIYCATCDAPLFKNKAVAVIGGGNSALDAALQLDKIATKIYLINLTPHYTETADKVMIEKVSSSSKVEVYHNSRTVEIIGEKFVKEMVIEDNETKKQTRLEVQGIFIEIGSEPSVAYLPSEVSLNKWHEIVIDEHNMSSLPGIFAAGDVTNITEKQVIIAAGEGAKGALGVSRFLNERHFAEIKPQSY